jgi:hypothetical protein
MAAILPLFSRRSILAVIAWCVLASGGLAPPAAHADVIALRSAELHAEDGDILLSAEFEVALNDTLEDALINGIPLYFELAFTLTAPRWYWFDETIVDELMTYRVTYAPLTRQYRVASGLLAQNFATLSEVERFLGRVGAKPVIRASALTQGVRYEAALRLRLDTGQLPKPLQVSALGSRDWQLASEWRRWAFTP